MKTIKTLLVLALVMLSNQNVTAQRPVLTDEEVVSETVTKEIDEVFQSEDFQKKKNKKYAEVKGTMVVDIGVVQNGKVSSFFKVDSDIKNIDFINFMSNYILEHKFKFKLQKQQRYKIRYTVTF
jgi:predicted component of type VI protein secretion system